MYFFLRVSSRILDSPIWCRWISVETLTDSGPGAPSQYDRHCPRWFRNSFLVLFCFCSFGPCGGHDPIIILATFCQENGDLGVKKSVTPSLVLFCSVFGNCPLHWAPAGTVYDGGPHWGSPVSIASTSAFLSKSGQTGLTVSPSAHLCFVSSGGFSSYYVVQTKQQILLDRGFQTDWSFHWLEVVHPSLSGQTAVTGERRPGETGKTLLSHFQMLGVTLACLAHRADNKLLFSEMLPSVDSWPDGSGFHWS